jgi:hypothetical protein
MAIRKENIMKTLLIIQAIALVLYSIPLILAPSTLMSFYGVSLSDGARVMLQLFGGVALGNALLSWLIRDASSSEIKQNILLTFFIHWSLGFVVSLIGQLSGAMNLLGWNLVVICFVLAIFFGYFRFFK